MCQGLLGSLSHYPEKRAIFFKNRQENGKGFGRLSQTHAANSEEKRSRPVRTAHLRIIRHAQNLTAAPSNLCSASMGHTLHPTL